MKTYCCKVAGVTFEGRQEIIALVRDGDDILLVPEPDNAFDRNAVKVLWQERHIGYLPKDTAAEVAPMLNGHSAAGWVMRCTGGTENFPTMGLDIEFEMEDEGE